LIPLSDERLMVVVVVQSGLVRSVIIEVEASFDAQSLIELESILNERLSGLSLAEIRDSIAKRMKDVSGHGKLLQLIVDSKDRIWTDSPAQDIKVSGTDNLVQQPEFSDLMKVSELMRVIENNKVLSDFLDNATQEELVITIGHENRFREIVDCSLVTSRYKVGNVVGTIGIIGPTRMDYNKLISVVDYTARAITEVLSGLEVDKD